MADDINNDSLLELYLYESTSLLDSLDHILLSAEEHGDLAEESVNEIFRIMHTIKGSSAMMAYTGIAEVSHKTEDLFDTIRNSGLDTAWFGELFDVVLAVSDFLKTEVSKVQEGLELETEIEPLTAVVAALTEKMSAGAPEEPKPDLGRTLGGAQAPEPEPEPAPAPLPSEPVPAPLPPEPAPVPLPPEPAPVPLPDPEPSRLEEYMPLAPEGGRMLGAEPPEGAWAPSQEEAGEEPDVLAADISKITARANEETSTEEDTCFLHVHFNEGSKMENIRAFMLINKLNEKGTVNRTIPANPEADPNAANAIIEQGFYLSYTSTLFREQIETLVKGTLSVESVSFVRRLPDDAGSGAETGTKPQPRPQPAHADAAPEHPAPAAPPPEPQAASQVPTQVPPQAASQVPAQAAPPPGPIPAPAFEKHPDYAAAPKPMQWPSAESSVQPQHHEPVRPTFVDVTKVSNTPASIDTLTAAPPPIRQPEPAEPQKTPEPYVPVQPAAPTASATPAAPAPTAAPAAPAPTAPRATFEPTTPGNTHANQNIISVELKKLDTLLDLVGEIVINETIVTQNPDLEGLELTNFNKAAHQLDKLTNELQDTVMSIRMLPVAIVFQRMRRIVRDMSKSLGKEANLILVGETTEVDKTILDALSDPIMHLIRNSMDHAIEAPSERIDSGKSVNGHIILSAQNSGGDVIISISDDGRGLDKDVILSKARSRGLLRKPESEYSDKEIFNLLMAPGFSTRDDVSEFSGRGVGLDVVKSNIEKIGGSVSIESKKGLGTNIIMKIPLTLAIISCMEIVIGKEIYSIPINNIRESFKAEIGQLITDPSGIEMIMLRGNAYPILRLYDKFRCDGAVTDIADGILVLVDAGDHTACILADRLVGKFQVVVKPLPRYLNKFSVNRSGISGCTIMGTGNISLIINVQELVD